MMRLRFTERNVLYLPVRIGPLDLLPFADETLGGT